MFISPAGGAGGTEDRVEERTVSVSESDGRLLQVRGLVKDYPGVRALGGVDLAVDSGQVIASSARTVPASQR